MQAKQADETGAEQPAEYRTLSTDPADYSPTDHFMERYSPDVGRASLTRTNPPITSEVIDTCITEGVELAHPANDRVRLEAIVDGRYWWLVVGDQRGYLEAITAYPPDPIQRAGADPLVVADVWVGNKDTVDRPIHDGKGGAGR